MIKTLAMFHTGPAVIGPLGDLARAAFPEIKIINFMDDGVVAAIESAGAITPGIQERVCSQLILISRQGVDAILVTCSSISPTVDVAQQLVDVPVLKIDEPMAEMAVRRGKKIAVVATLHTTLIPSVSMVREKARENGASVDIIQELCRGAFEALQSGNPSAHDEIVAERIKALAPHVDVIVLAQASMARLVHSLPDALKSRVLSSPESGVKNAARALGFKV